MHLGIDLGSGSVKLLLVDGAGEEHEASQSYPIESPRPGFAETKPELWLHAIREAVTRLPSLECLQSIGFSGQMHGVVPVSLSEGRAIHPAIIWADSRGKKYLSRLEAARRLLEEQVLNPPAAGMAATTIIWLKEEAPEIYRRADLFLFPKDYVRWQLTGVAGTDYSDASGSLLYDFRSRSWSWELIDFLGLDAGKLPEIRGAVDEAGRVSEAASSHFGFPPGVPVGVGAADTPAALFGGDLTREEEVQMSVGTAAQVGRPLHALPTYNPSLNHFEGATEDVHYRIAAMLNCGLALEWMRKILGYRWEHLYGEIESANLLPPEDLLFLPYLSGERTPYMNPEARGAWVGLSLHHEPVHLALAAMGGVASSVRLGLETLGTEGVERIRLVGGSARYDYWARLLASLLNWPLHRSDMTNGSARGAARIGARAIGEELTFEENFERIEPVGLPWVDEYYGRFKELYKRLHP
ncbi:MAG: xylulokinase [Spirochaetaceae bacterium]